LISRIPFILALFVCLPASAEAQQTLRATRITTPLVIDGRLSEEAWSHADVADHFTQRDPDEGQPATERTEIRIVYDADALYVGARMHDREPDRITRRLSSRDFLETDADRVMIFLDPRHDRRTGAEFWISASGVQRDAVISNDTNEDTSWDAVWTSAVAFDNQGWLAELRIPYSQLRFSEGQAQTWGFNVARFIQRKNETSWLELVPKNENGLASRMMLLTGLDGIHTTRRLELAPYVAARQEFVQPDTTGDPFNDGARMFGSVGLDVKAGVTGGLTLDVTINPDFGQAEVDPAVVNLSAFETFFDEKRRFFIEGADIFNNFGMGGSNSFFGFNTSDPSLFYSRRIGRAPQGTAGGDFVDLPRAATIVGAAKLTGKTANGWTIGLLEAVTGLEKARVVTGVVRSRAEVEPRTNYFVGRLHRDFTRGGAGFLTTWVARDLQTPELRDQLTRRAFVFGGDAFYFFDHKKDWVVTGKLSGSRISGSEAAIAGMQRAPQRYFQRPDAPEVSLDGTRQSLSGYAGRVNLNRNEGVWRVNAALWGVSPGFESNDLGFHQTGDRAGGHAVLIWVNNTVDRWTRSRGAWISKSWVWNFNRELQGNLWFACARARFLNYWSGDLCASHFYRTLDDRLTRGGPLSITPGGNGVNLGLDGDARKTVSFNLHAGRDWDEFGSWSINDGITVVVKALPSLTISTGPQLSKSKTAAQYVGTRSDPAATATFGERYVFAPIDQTQVTLTTRINYILTPRASLQVFMQPLLAGGKYKDFQELAAPRTYEFKQFVAADGTPAFDNPDFNFKSLKVNAVFRWEFTPGSTLYGVWTEQREDLSHPGDLRFRRDAAALFSAPADDVFLVKMTYWIGR
jgi:hypothetical protein